ncbi:MAG: biopolymer transporter ExbD [Leptolyngbya foveolarum]|uniref:Biopolymer transporter ExbD n=1 Tax=Leptolyngbya foveolarum TaxID=47253 RepID=A0A2W4VS25_9CYAN|nr:MAG: biopolymer transporter ExbD [Leptolyngbya foveolarum]
MRLSEDNDIKSSSVNILPMIDVIFAILAFFIISTLYLTSSEGLLVNLPEAVTATPQTQVNVTLTITAEGDLFLEDEAVVLEDLAGEVRSLSPNAPISVTVRADRATPHGTVVTAMDKLRTIENVRLSIATTQP